MRKRFLSILACVIISCNFITSVSIASELEENPIETEQVDTKEDAAESNVINEKITIDEEIIEDDEEVGTGEEEDEDVYFTEELEDTVNIEEATDEVLEAIEEIVEDINALEYKELSSEVAEYSITAKGNMPEDTTLIVERIDDAEAEAKIESNTSSAFNSLVTFDIKLVSEAKDYQPTEYGEDVEISIKGIHIDTSLQVYRITDDGIVTNMNASNTESEVLFSTDHFTTYTIGETEYESFEEGSYLGMKAVTYDTDGDGTAETVVLSGTQTDRYSNYSGINRPDKSIFTPKITRLIVEPGTKVIDCSSMFDITGGDGNFYLKYIDITGLDTSEVEDMSSMFWGYAGEEIKGLETLDTSRVTTMQYIFYHNDKLKDLRGIYNWNTSKVEDLSAAFEYDIALKELDLSAWDVGNVTNLTEVFSSSGIRKLDISGWNLKSINPLTSYSMEEYSRYATYTFFNSAFSLRELKMCRTDSENISSLSFPLYVSSLSDEYKEAWCLDDDNDGLTDDGIFYEGTLVGASEPHTYKRAYSVVFNPNNGQENFIQYVIEGQTIKEPEGITKKDYELAGWYTARGFEDKKRYDFSQVLNGYPPGVIFAEWDEVIKNFDGYNTISNLIKKGLEKNLVTLIVPSESADPNAQYFVSKPMDEEYGTYNTYRYICDGVSITGETILNQEDVDNQTGKAILYTVNISGKEYTCLAGRITQKPGADGRYGTEDDSEGWTIEAGNYFYMFNYDNDWDELYERYKSAWSIFPTNEKIILDKEEWDYYAKRIDDGRASGSDYVFNGGYVFRLADFKLELKNEDGKTLFKDYITYGTNIAPIVASYGEKWIDSDGNEYEPDYMPLNSLTLTLGHTHIPMEPVEENRTNPTHNSAGQYNSVIYCKDCGEELSRETITIPATDHNPATAVVENRVEPTCTEAGHYDSVIYCKDDGDELSRTTVELEPTGHVGSNTVKENIINATEDEEGSYEEVVYCAHCNKELSRESKTIAKIEVIIPVPSEPTGPVDPIIPDRPSTEDNTPENPSDEEPSNPIEAIEEEPQEIEEELETEEEVVLTISTDRTGSYPAGSEDDLEFKTVEIIAMAEDEDIDNNAETKTVTVKEPEEESDEIAEVIKAVVVTLSVAGSSGGIFFVFIWFRRRKVKGKILSKDGIDYAGCLVTLEGKDKLRTRTNKNGEFTFRNLKKDTYVLTVFNENKEILFSCELLLSNKNSANSVPNVLENNALSYQYAVAGASYILDIFA